MLESLSWWSWPTRATRESDGRKRKRKQRNSARSRKSVTARKKSAKKSRTAIVPFRMPSNVRLMPSSKRKRRSRRRRPERYSVGRRS